MKILKRPFYLSRIEHNFGRNSIIILTGQRRVGKSYLLRSLRECLDDHAENNIIFIDKEKKEFDSILNYGDLNNYIENHKNEDAKNYVLIDEIQDIAGFERTLRAYYEEDNFELVVTGSNSKMLSSELSTIIGGRYKEIYVQSLTYQEFLLFHELEDSDDALAKYLRFGGLPGLVRTGLTADDALEYQNDVLSTVLLKDIIMRHEIRNVSFLQNLIRYLADNTGKLISATNVAKYMKSNGNSISTGLILNYLEYLTESYVTKKVTRYDIHGKRLFDSNDKYYFQDIGLRNSLIRGVRTFDIEKLIENVVYNHLIFMGYEVYVGQLRNKEIDFVASGKGQSTIYIQVAYIIGSDETYQREFGNLREIRDNYPKYVISSTPSVDVTSDDGITHLSLRRFLAEGFINS